MKIYSALTLFVIVMFVTSCGKDQVSNQDIQTKKINDIIPQQYQDSLKKLGLNINTGTTPPNVEGVYAVMPVILLASNFNDFRQPGYQFADAVLKLYNQSNKDFGISLIGKNFIRERDTSIATAVSGSGNQFTVYGKVKSTNLAGKYAIYALVGSGSMENGNIKNFKFGIINIDNSNGDATFIAQGQGRIAYDSDLTSEKVGDNMIATVPWQSTSTGQGIGGAIK